jgi:2-phosphoglycerate kinase
MTIDPRFNKYISSLKQIRTIQDYLVKNSEEILIPRIENHNVDRSVSLIQTTVMRCLHKIIQGDKLYDHTQKRATGIHDVVQTI